MGYQRPRLHKEEQGGRLSDWLGHKASKGDPEWQMRNPPATSIEKRGPGENTVSPCQIETLTVTTYRGGQWQGPRIIMLHGR